MKGQVSTELMVIIGVILVIFIPLLVTIYMKADETQNEMASYQAEVVVFRLAYLANSVGSLGTDTAVYTDIYIPKGTESLSIKNVGKGAEIQLKVNTPQGEKDFSEVIKYPVKDTTLIKQKYGWTRFKISNSLENNKAVITIEKVG